LDDQILVIVRLQNGFKLPPNKATIIRNFTSAGATIKAMACREITKKPKNGIKKLPTKVIEKQNRVCGI
jgi:hypothetical protein